jgi:hypothetical protein
MYRKFVVLGLVGLLAGLGWLASTRAAAQQAAGTDWQDPAKAIAFQLDPQSGLSIVSQNLGDTEIYTRGGAIVIDLRCGLVVKNEGRQNVRGVVFAVLAQQLTAGGKASVAVPSLNVAPGQTFPVKLNLRLLRPLPGPPNPLVTVTADGVLLADLSFRGPDTLDSRRRMTAWEMEARRERDYFQAVLKSGGEEELQQEMLASLARQKRRPRVEARLAGSSGSTVSSAVSASAERQVQLAFLDFPESPLELVSGTAQVSGAMASSPRIQVRNRSQKPVRYFELGWLVSDASGTLYSAGSVPTSTPELNLKPGETLSANRQSASSQRRFLFTPTSGSESDFAIQGMSGYFRQVQFEDGGVWIPARQDLARSELTETIPVSAEEQRLSDIYRVKGLKALLEELRRF